MQRFEKNRLYLHLYGKRLAEKLQTIISFPFLVLAARCCAWLESAARKVVRELRTLVCDRPHNLLCQLGVGEQSIDKRCEDFLAGDARET